MTRSILGSGAVFMAYKGLAEPQPLGAVEISFTTLACTSGVCDVHGSITADLVDPSDGPDTVRMTTVF